MSLYSIETFGQLEPYLTQEWLLTNGLGGFAQSTVVGCNTRRYHGLLCAATLPPVGRVMALNRIGEIVTIDGKPEQYELSVNQFRDHLHPRGDQYLRRFDLDDNVVRWEFEIPGATIVKELQLLWMKNIVGVRYTIETQDSKSRVQLRLIPFTSLRDFHALRHAGDGAIASTPAAQQVTVEAHNLHLNLWSREATFQPEPDWWYGHLYNIEKERGLDHVEDLFKPGAFVFETQGAGRMTLWGSLEAPIAPDWDAELKRRREAIAKTIHPVAQPTSGDQSLAVRRLFTAANDFVVYRKAPDGSDGTSIIAGYPWFADWGRDTMISLPGLLLVPGRYRQAREVLTVFAAYVSQGMIPNRFDDYSNEPHYNTVDASLWFIHAVFEYLRYSKDQETFEKKLLPACQAIIDGHKAGTRFNIRMDPADSLITQGDAHTQLTWMDAKHGDIAFTPRQGKAVEINALWYHALRLMKEDALANKVAESFRKMFWISPFRGLYDVVDGDRKDATCRPNQIFAVSLPNSPLTEDQQHTVVEIVRRELLTPVGLRSLAPGDKNYHAHYFGGPMERDAAYHNGTVWAWPIGAFLDAYLRVHKRSTESVDQAKRWLAPLIDQLEGPCVGQIAEIFDADSPHKSNGCPAQAWSVAEVLRLAVALQS